MTFHIYIYYIYIWWIIYENYTRTGVAMCSFRLTAEGLGHQLLVGGPRVGPDRWTSRPAPGASWSAHLVGGCCWLGHAAAPTEAPPS